MGALSRGAPASASPLRWLLLLICRTAQIPGTCGLVPPTQTASAREGSGGAHRPGGTGGQSTSRSSTAGTGDHLVPWPRPGVRRLPRHLGFLRGTTLFCAVTPPERRTSGRANSISRPGHFVVRTLPERGAVARPPPALAAPWGPGRQGRLGPSGPRGRTQGGGRAPAAPSPDRPYPPAQCWRPEPHSTWRGGARRPEARGAAPIGGGRPPAASLREREGHTRLCAEATL